MQHQEKNYLIIGASTGIGLRLAQLLTVYGAQVYTASRHMSDALKATGAHYTPWEAGQTAHAIVDSLPSHLDGVVYCPGTINLKPFGRLSQDDFLKDLQINVLGAIQVLQAIHPKLKAAPSGASVVLFSTVAVGQGMPFHASVATAKGAIEGLMRSLAAEWASQKIRVNAIAPALTDTPLAGNLLSTPEKQEASHKRHPIGRYGTADDIAQAASWLLAPEGSWVTGQVIPVDGGLSRLR